MKLEDARQHYYDHSGSLSTVNRQLALAGIAIVWIFVAGNGEGDYVLDHALVMGLFLFALSLLFDICQYWALTHAWKKIIDEKERKKTKESTTFSVPKSTNEWGERCFFIKPIFTALGYVCLLFYTVKTFSPALFEAATQSLHG